MASAPNYHLSRMISFPLCILGDVTVPHDGNDLLSTARTQPDESLSMCQKLVFKLRDAGFSSAFSLSNGHPEMADVLPTFAVVVDEYRRQSQVVADLLESSESWHQERAALDSKCLALSRDLTNSNSDRDRAKNDLAQAKKDLAETTASHKLSVQNLHMAARKMKSALQQSREEKKQKESDLSKARSALSSVEVGARESSREVGDQALALRQSSIKILALTKSLEERDKEARQLGESLSAAKSARTKAESLLDLASKESTQQIETELAAVRARADALSKIAADEIRTIKADVESVRQSADQQLMTAQEEIRGMQSEIKEKTQALKNQSLVLRSKEREWARLRDREDLNRFATEKRMSAAEEDRIVLESELQSGRVRCAQLENIVKNKDREIDRLVRLMGEEKRMGISDVSKVDEEAIHLLLAPLQEEILQSKVKVARIEATIQEKDSLLVKSKKASDALIQELHEAGAKSSAAAALHRDLQGSLAQAQQQVIRFESMQQVKSREINSLSRLLDSSTANENVLSSQLIKAEELRLKLAGDLGSARRHERGLETMLEASVRAKSVEVARLESVISSLRANDRISDPPKPEEGSVGLIQSEIREQRSEITRQREVIEKQRKANETQKRELESLLLIADSKHLKTEEDAKTAIDEGRRLKVRVLSLTRVICSRDAKIKSLAATISIRDLSIKQILEAREVPTSRPSMTGSTSQSNIHRILSLERLCRLKEIEVDKIKAILVEKVSREERLDEKIDVMSLRRSEAYANLYKNEAKHLSSLVVQLSNDSIKISSDLNRMQRVLENLETWINSVCASVLEDSSASDERSILESFHILRGDFTPSIPLVSPQHVPRILDVIRSWLSSRSD